MILRTLKMPLMLFATLLLIACGGGGGTSGGGTPPAPTLHQVTLNWEQNLEADVNALGGGYKVAISGQPIINVPFPAPLSITLTLPSGSYSAIVTAYSAIDPSTGMSDANATLTNATNLSRPSAPITIDVP